MDSVKPVYACKKIKVKAKVKEVDCVTSRLDSNPKKSKKPKTDM